METTLSRSVPANLIRQYCFCPRISWFNEVKQINPGDRKWQTQGVSFHERQSMLIKRRHLAPFGFANGELKLNIQLQSNILNCHGFADAIIFTEHKLAALDFKLAGNKPSNGQVFQVAAYGMMAEEMYRIPCHKVFILIGKKGQIYSFKLDKKLRQNVRNVLNRIVADLSLPVLPDSSATSAQCSQCEYYNFCGDR